GIASLLVALSIPLLGAISDARRRRVPWVIGFTLIAVAATITIGAIGYNLLPLVGDSVVGGAVRAEGWHVDQSTLLWILAAFVVANYAYQASLPFYNAMLPELAPPGEQGRLSGLGTAVGYLGSIAGVFLITPFFTGGFPVFGALPERFIDWIRSVVPFTSQGGRVSTFAPTGLMYLLFTIPFIVFCRDHRATAERHAVKWKEAFRNVVQTVKDSRRHPGAFRFIMASFLYQDAMGTIISFMALYAVTAMGFAKGAETTLFVVLTVPAVIGSFAIGHLIDGFGIRRVARLGPKRTLMLVLVAWIVLLIAMILAPNQKAFWVVGFGIGLIYGGVATTERPLLLTLVPDVDAGKFFGLMVLSARAAAIVGPLIWGLTVDQLTPVIGVGLAYRAAVGTVAIAMIIALFLLRGVPDKSQPVI
ncbi:MAG TPA: MFS transporter, partial [Gemmatimonadaceae bacterium]|nr:MFS transporter [Gemmatimonadaceae bacterium]